MPVLDGTGNLLEPHPQAKADDTDGVAEELAADVNIKPEWIGYSEGAQIPSCHYSNWQQNAPRHRIQDAMNLYKSSGTHLNNQLIYIKCQRDARIRMTDYTSFSSRRLRFLEI